MKKTTLITLLLLLLFVQSKAQTVTGRIVDSEKQAVVMATIALQTLDSVNICATTADADGRFVLTADSIPLPFRLIVSSIGYETVMPECASYAVGDVVLATKTNVLGDVVVKSKRPILNVQGDRIVADASSIIKGRIVTCAFDVAKYVPGILCKNDNELSLAGTSPPRCLSTARCGMAVRCSSILRRCLPKRCRRWSCFTMLRQTCTLREPS